MARFTVNSHRTDPYKNFKFRIKWNGRYVAGFSKASSLAVDPPPPGKSPGRTKYDAITLERGVTHDPDFEAWANGVVTPGERGAQGSQKALHRDLILEVLNEVGKVALAYRIHRCWISEIQALPELDANANAVAIEHITLENEGWETEPGSKKPASTSQ